MDLLRPRVTVQLRDEGPSGVRIIVVDLGKQLRFPKASSLGFRPPVFPSDEPPRGRRGRRAGCSQCDLCDDQLSPHAFVYTCDNGDHTILHPTTYDVCEECFVRYSVDGASDEGLAKERRN